MVFRYENFFIPRVEKSSKIGPWEKILASCGPTALGLFFEEFSTLGMKKFPYLKTGPFGNPIFAYYSKIVNWEFLIKYIIIKELYVTLVPLVSLIIMYITETSIKSFEA